MSFFAAACYFTDSSFAGFHYRFPFKTVAIISHSPAKALHAVIPY
jgi:hypothetical protein